MKMKLVPRLRMSGAIPSLALCDLMACTGTLIPLLLPLPLPLILTFGVRV